jgi:hypothetical protein
LTRSLLSLFLGERVFPPTELKTIIGANLKELMISSVELRDHDVSR